jgi:hypothetical protein
MSLGKSRMRTGRVFLLGFILCAAPNLAAAREPDACTLPHGLEAKIAAKYPNAHVVRVTDLSEDDRNLYAKDHGASCPGLVKIDFYGDGKPTWALVLISGDNPQEIKSHLVVVRLHQSVWNIRTLATAIGIPVVWKERAGEYKDMYGRKTIRSSRPVLVLAITPHHQRFMLGMARQSKRFGCRIRL